MLVIIIDARDNFRLMSNLMLGFTVVVGLGPAVVFGWIIKRLVSKEVKREFLAP
jgi:hypothetical protein